MGVQLEFPDMSDTGRKPRLTLKAKKSAVTDMMQQIKNGWEPNEETWRLIDWLQHDIATADQKKG